MGRGRDLWRLLLGALRMRRDIGLLDEIDAVLHEARTELDALADDLPGLADERAALVNELEQYRALDLNLGGEFEELRDRALLLLAKVRMANGRPAGDA
ncbi:hypothetical protein [Actinocorallia sp. A-T 12471]|uniref:hypothetical protein n=1 Tax=Actinocorallia sp. A-T 12471 TaxID=3089813 RepID=UPI0029CB7E02|nr:hypothetical protein [Actinocorallia sp. A-T 12471]MDX6743887.1 hypothetical protein [Actinocorallia sp. A-T 12471]